VTSNPVKTVSVEALHLPPDVLQALRDDQEVLLVTDHGKPLARVLPYPSREANPLKDSIVLETDIVSPIDDNWAALR
jgi:antitoxin (DNA-binding transcriptional repressor) of toxin-antitoxin stability system